MVRRGRSKEKRAQEKEAKLTCVDVFNIRFIDFIEGEDEDVVTIISHDSTLFQIQLNDNISNSTQYKLH